jgi:hypothetical protein
MQEEVLPALCEDLTVGEFEFAATRELGGARGTELCTCGFGGRDRSSIRVGLTPHPIPVARFRTFMPE